MDGMTYQLGWFNFPEALLWNLNEFYFLSFLEDGVYPDDWKKNNVIPVHKKENKNMIKN